MLQPRKMVEIADEARKFKINILAIHISDESAL
jgi:hypothetical protein